MIRTTDSILTRTISKATHEGWDLTFVHEISGDQDNVFCNGRNDQGGSINATRTGTNNSGVNFFGWVYDSVIAADIVAEMDLIINPA